MAGSGSRSANAHVQSLLDKIRSYEEQLATHSERGSVGNQQAGYSPGGRGSSVQHPVFIAPAPRQGGPATPSTHGIQEPLSEGVSYPDNDDGISPATDLTSGPAFESQVRSLLHRNQPYSDSNKIHADIMGVDSSTSQWKSSQALVNETSAPMIPSLSESQHLLDRFLFYLGVSQHFFDPRTFSDSMMLLFQSPERQRQQTRTTWFTEYLLVMAMAKLMDVEEPTSQPPGASLFAEAMRRLPRLHQLGEEGVIAVEILTLITTYLQWCDRKHDAYLYVGMALRLAIALGCNRPAAEQNFLPSETAHRVRLWWTVYMLDRRLSSGLGLAAGADERQLRVEFPRHAIGFQSPIALIINVRIARTTDDIMSSLYGNASITQIELVRKVQMVLHGLYETGRCLPAPLLLDFSRPLQTVTRTGASLYLMLFQAIILCTRPILLQRVRQKVRRQAEQQPLEPAPPILTRLCETCNEAATKSLSILFALQRQRIIPRYGFFDLDATFSAAFILVMMGFVGDSESKLSPALEQAFVVLRFLSQAGNLAAEQRLQDILQSCLRVWPDHSTGDKQQESSNQAPAGTPSTPSRPPPAGSYTPLATDGFNSLQEESRLLEPWMHPEMASGVFDMQGGWNMDLSGEAEGIYSSFYDPTMPLTGVDYTDWVEIEKVLGGLNT
ncbi:fungal specific transcription factor domain-containing protein [Aspergillus affinis]|uniref:fungal specific transcription factor domain-containing protein n=1 Tax=Aspergillus affinis TaxID=1070780 RepID=UPI0022FF41F0|nr:uncharacterized protein KD926_007880 [Aspergillus affinis]KAI9040664.1 hypothetical protein KD926_007880 [Aspergillus affinis]